MKNNQNFSVKNHLSSGEVLYGKAYFKNFSFIDNILPYSICFTNKKLKSYKNISILVTNQKELFKSNVPSVIYSKNPKETFYKLMIAFLNEKNGNFFPEVKSKIHDSCIFEGNHHISDVNVKIGKNCIIKNNVTINSNTIIGDNCIIHENTVLGSQGNNFQTIGNKKTLIPHGGKLIISNNVNILQNTVIDKSFLSQPTKIGSNNLIDSNVKIGHGTIIGKENTICAGVVIGGFAKIGNNNFIGMGAVIVNGKKILNDCFISSSHNLIKNLKSKSKVIDNPTTFLIKN